MGRTLLIGIRAALYAAGFIFLWWWASTGVREFDRKLGIILPRELIVVGVALIAAGGVLAAMCVINFAVTGRGTPAPFDAPREFVAVGPYRFVRNPMYIGAALMIAGFGLYERSASILVFSAAFLVVAHLFVLFYEEPTLADRFGDSYLAYKRSTRRWLPHA
jgi:protein-S-isoprenylcysteine O-methyltransferase Ste14